MSSSPSCHVLCGWAHSLIPCNLNTKQERGYEPGRALGTPHPSFSNTGGPVEVRRVPGTPGDPSPRSTAGCGERGEAGCLRPHCPLGNRNRSQYTEQPPRHPQLHSALTETRSKHSWSKYSRPELLHNACEVGIIIRLPIRTQPPRGNSLTSALCITAPTSTTPALSCGYTSLQGA